MGVGSDDTYTAWADGRICHYRMGVSYPVPAAHHAAATAASAAADAACVPAAIVAWTAVAAAAAAADDSAVAIASAAELRLVFADYVFVAASSPASAAFAEWSVAAAAEKSLPAWNPISVFSASALNYLDPDLKMHEAVVRWLKPAPYVMLDTN